MKKTSFSQGNKTLKWKMSDPDIYRSQLFTASSSAPPITRSTSIAISPPHSQSYGSNSFLAHLDRKYFFIHLFICAPWLFVRSLTFSILCFKNHVNIITFFAVFGMIIVYNNFSPLMITTIYIWEQLACDRLSESA